MSCRFEIARRQSAAVEQFDDDHMIFRARVDDLNAAHGVLPRPEPT
jgi:hypothetical protein